MSMLEFRHPIPVSTPLGEGYALYVTDGGTMENDLWCVCLDDGRFLHFRTNDCRSVGNATVGVKRPPELVTAAQDKALSTIASVSRRMAEDARDR
jgi:hypothetical protein